MANKILTVDILYELLKEERKKGNGKKQILLSDDDEGNGFHYLFFGITPAKEFFDENGCCYCNMPFSLKAEDAIKNFVVLG